MMGKIPIIFLSFTGKISKNFLSHIGKISVIFLSSLRGKKSRIFENFPREENTTP